MWHWVMALELEHNTGVNLISETFTSVIYKSYCFQALKNDYTCKLLQMKLWEH